MSDDRAELDTFVKALKNKPSPREKWEDLQVVDFRLRGYNSSEGARCILHLDCITKSSENIRLTSFSDKAVFEKLRGVKPQTVLKVSGVYKPHPGKWLAQELTRAEVIGPTDRLVKLEQSPLERARSSTGLFMSDEERAAARLGNQPAVFPSLQSTLSTSHERAWISCWRTSTHFNCYDSSNGTWYERSQYGWPMGPKKPVW